MAVILVNVRAAKVALLLLQRLRSVFSLYMILKVIIQPMSHCGTAARQLFVLSQLKFILSHQSSFAWSQERGKFAFVFL